MAPLFARVPLQSLVPISSLGAAYQRRHLKVSLMVAFHLILQAPHICSLPVADRLAHTDCLREDHVKVSDFKLSFHHGREGKAKPPGSHRGGPRGRGCQSPAGLRLGLSSSPHQRQCSLSLTPRVCLCIVSGSSAGTEVELHTLVHH